MRCAWACAACVRLTCVLDTGRKRFLPPSSAALCAASFCEPASTRGDSKGQDGLCRERSPVCCDGRCARCCQHGGVLHSILPLAPRMGCLRATPPLQRAPPHASLLAYLSAIPRLPSPFCTGTRHAPTSHSLCGAPLKSGLSHCRVGGRGGDGACQGGGGCSTLTGAMVHHVRNPHRQHGYHMHGGRGTVPSHLPHAPIIGTRHAPSRTHTRPPGSLASPY